MAKLNYKLVGISNLLTIYNSSDIDDKSVNESNQHITSPKNAINIIKFYRRNYSVIMKNKFYPQLELTNLAAIKRTKGNFILISEIFSFNIFEIFLLIAALSKLIFLIIKMKFLFELDKKSLLEYMRKNIFKFKVK